VPNSIIGANTGYFQTECFYSYNTMNFFFIMNYPVYMIECLCIRNVDLETI